MTLKEKQQLFLDLARSGRNIYLSGKAGTGKSFVTKEFIRESEEQGKNIAVLAPTGVAANNIGGMTIHSFFKIPIQDKVLNFKTLNSPREDRAEIFDATDIFIIDEVSMLRPDILNACFLLMKKAETPNYLKKQFIFIGDLEQLEAVIKDEELKPMLKRFGGSKFYDIPDWNALNVEEIELDEIVRQSDPEFIDNLNILREGGQSVYFKNFLTKEAKGIILAPYNKVVDEYNVKGLAKHPGEIITYINTASGLVKPQDFDLPDVIHLKEGCKIMCLVNNMDMGVVNGSLGTYTRTMYEQWKKNPRYQQAGFKDSHLEFEVVKAACPGIKLEDGRVVPLPPVTYEKIEYEKDGDKLKKKVIGTVKAYPVRLAYALSIHKSQGLTFEQVTVDLRKPCFAKGQLYTAFSRVKTPEGLNIIM